ncbi:peptide ABC transporter substrate-binding protein [Thalassococcus sp. S3]|uniref:peptide ABC transporter substrate-binding protein n=1 Tax=Thalassococcus sp. S3 TaxID=2017482 RepID=UPI00102443F7|nr:peptide ABC transporter substrate-binding protein [Thalassococcus sp. S3]QBF33944.1 ABC transporter substrate-binding protein [Thalassococcus sp. S3]
MFHKPMHSGLLLSAVFALSVGAAQAQTYVRGNSGDPETLDQHKTSTVVEGHVLRDLYEGLVVYNSAAEVVPGVAESWEASEDGTIYTFTLREGAKWSNGDPVTADDFVFSLNRIMRPETGAKYANILYAIKGAEAINKGEEAELGVRAIDDRTLEITLENSTPFFIELLTHQTALPVHPASVEEYGADFVRPGNMVSNGAYSLVSFTPNDKLVMEKNEMFHDAENVAIARIEYTPFEDRANCARRFQAGEVHSCDDIAAEQLADLKSRLGEKVQIHPYLGVYYYGMNSTREGISDVRVRQAMSMAIDREFIAEEIWAGAMLPAYALVPPGTANYVEEPPQLEYAGMAMLDREDQAIALMEEAGFGPDNPITIEISYNTSENHRATATAIADMWAPLGINVTYNVRDLSAHYANLRDQKDHDAARAGWIGDYSDPQNFLFLNRADNPGFNYGLYDNPEYDGLLDKAAETTDLTERAQILAEAEALFLRDVPQIPILFYSSLNLVSDRLQGWQGNIMDVHPTRFLSLSE